MRDRTHREFSNEDIEKIAETYHNWRKKDGKYEDIKGFCKSATLVEIQKHKFIITPGRYVGIKEEEDDGVPFEEKMKLLTNELSGQIEDEKKLNREIKTKISKIGFEIK